MTDTYNGLPVVAVTLKVNKAGEALAEVPGRFVHGQHVWLVVEAEIIDEQHGYASKARDSVKAKYVAEACAAALVNRADIAWLLTPAEPPYSDDELDAEAEAWALLAHGMVTD